LSIVRRIIVLKEFRGRREGPENDSGLLETWAQRALEQYFIDLLNPPGRRSETKAKISAELLKLGRAKPDGSGSPSSTKKIEVFYIEKK
jgi:hypothetical protein